MRFENVREWIDARQDEYNRQLSALVAIDSVRAPQTGSRPYGDGCAAALDHILALGEAFGFEAQNHQYHGGSLLLPGSGKGELGIFAHLDVVPVGDGWLTEPFAPTIRDGFLFGRGSADNKGPLLAALFAMRYLREQGISLAKTVRLFCGCNEEEGMGDVEHFLSHHPAPDFSFTPDASFSVCFGEKGILKGELSAPLNGCELLELTAGVSGSMVPAHAQALLRGEKARGLAECAAGADGITAASQNGIMRVEAEGLAAHAGMPEGSVNAAQKLAAFLVASRLLSPTAESLLTPLAEGFADCGGEGVGISISDHYGTALTMIGNLTRVRDGRLIQGFNIQYPTTDSPERSILALKGYFEPRGWRLDSWRDNPSYRLEPDLPQIALLNQICNDALGSDYRPYIMGGGTYARKVPNTVAYGPAIPGQVRPCPEGHGRGHQPDECVRLQYMYNAIEIYARALAGLDAL